VLSGDDRASIPTEAELQRDLARLLARLAQGHHDHQRSSEELARLGEEVRRAAHYLKGLEGAGKPAHEGLAEQLLAKRARGGSQE
jgi:hypothetical protein